MYNIDFSLTFDLCPSILWTQQAPTLCVGAFCSQTIYIQMAAWVGSPPSLFVIAVGGFCIHVSIVQVNIHEPMAWQTSSFLALQTCQSDTVSLVIGGRCVVTAFDSCTKCIGIPGIIHDRTPDCPRVSHSSQLNVAFICKLRG